jgi:hypothetical protein
VTSDHDFAAVIFHIDGTLFDSTSVADFILNEPGELLSRLR